MKPPVFNTEDQLPLFKQIVRYISMEIEKGVYDKGFRLLSINDFSEKYNVARDTVERAYKELKKEGYITSSMGKGYFVIGGKEDKLKVLLIFNKLSSYKKIVYYSLLETLGDQARVDLQIHHYDPALLKEIVENNLGKYHYYVIMPHFFQPADEETFQQTLNKIPAGELVLLDKNLSGFTENIAVFQDFRNDTADALESEKKSMDKYLHFTVVFPENINHPPEIIEGIKTFCKRNNKTFQQVEYVDEIALEAGTVYIVISEDDLALLIKKLRKSPFEMGKDLGVISFNETVLKELLDITVITTDFEMMGQKAAQLMLNREFLHVRNPFKMIKRSSL